METPPVESDDVLGPRSPWNKIVAWYHYDFKYEITRKKEMLLLWFVSRLPREVAYRACIRVGADATTGAYSSQIVPELTFFEAIERWHKRDGGDWTNRKFKNKKSDSDLYIDQPILTVEYDPAHDLAEALRLTVEYVGNDMLPAREGWSWYDALNRYNPDMVRPFVEKPIHFAPNSSRWTPPDSDIYETDIPQSPKKE